VADWLTRAGFSEYSRLLADQGGAALLLHTEASLLLAGVAPQHCAALRKIDAAAREPPRTDEPEARAR
jgi:hypothetical protein